MALHRKREGPSGGKAPAPTGVQITATGSDISQPCLRQRR